MPGQATVTIGEKSWSCFYASAPAELQQGLSGVAYMYPETGMFFDTGCLYKIGVQTYQMNFPLDVAFISPELKVVDIKRNVEPGIAIVSDKEAYYFLEVNAGELDGINAGDGVIVGLLPTSTEEDSPSTEENMLTGIAMVTLIVIAGSAIGLISGKGK
jgi:uncharacterized membrane protein (UPF0127 family)